MFRRRENYGRILPTRQWRGAPHLPWWKRWFRAWRWWLMLALLLTAMHYLQQWWQDAISPPGGTRITVGQTFHRCGQGRGPNCVVDGDTFIMAARHFRIIGVDAPEVGAKAGCPAEAQLAEEAAAGLLSLLNQGPFIMQAPQDGLRDLYGRELVAVTRTRADGTVQDIAGDLITSGKVHPYDRAHPRGGWC